MVFDVTRIESAIARAAREVGRDDPRLAGDLEAEVAGELGTRFVGRPAGVEQIQDAVPGILVHVRTALEDAPSAGLPPSGRERR